MPTSPPAPVPVAVAPSRGRSRPWWIPPFLGSIPELDPPVLRLFGLVALAFVFEQYDLSMLTSALKFIARDLGMDESALGRATAWIRLGALPAFLVVPFADRLGRRRVFLWSVIGISFATLATAFVGTAAQFVLVQMVVRTFLLTGSMTAFVIVTEEFPAAHRGWGIGMLGALGACGAGLGTVLFAAIDYLPYGWRALYAVGILPLLLLPLFRRGVRETRRFERYRREQLEPRHGSQRWGKWLQPVISLARTHPRRAVVVALLAGLSALGSIAPFQFIGYFTQSTRGWTPGQYALMVFFGGGVGIIGNVVAGRLGDSVGRRAVAAVLLALFPVSVWTFYQGPSWVLPLAWIVMLFCSDGSDVLIRALSFEVFPTSQRGTSGGWLSLVQTLGASAGLALIGLETKERADLAQVTSLLSLATLVAAATVFLLPETRRRELEAISPETEGEQR